MIRKDAAKPRVVCLAGGVGGAKLADGLARILPPENLTVIVNTGDDFRHFGLTICPDLDTVMYTLGEVANPETGWGRAGESRRAIDEVGRLGGPDWFSLGDLDLATHLTRTHWLDSGETLTAVTRRLCSGFGIRHAVLPMTDQPAPTLIETETGEVLPFQRWFVRERWQPAVRRVVLPEDVRATQAVVRALESADVVVIAPSNPFVSIDPILNVYPIRALIEDVPQAVVAVSPIVAGRAVKGPAAKMMVEPPTLVGILDRMERDGWITRHGCVSDRRKKLVRANPAAEPVWDKIVECALRVRERATAGLSERQLATLKKLLAQVQANLKSKAVVESLV